MALEIFKTTEMPRFLVPLLLILRINLYLKRNNGILVGDKNVAF